MLLYNLTFFNKTVCMYFKIALHMSSRDTNLDCNKLTQNQLISTQMIPHIKESLNTFQQTIAKTEFIKQRGD